MAQLAAELLASLQGAAAFTHRLSQGEYIEADYEETLRRFIPRRFGLSSGQVVNADGQSSRQQDLIITDAVSTAPFVASGRLGVHPIESVHATVCCRQRYSVTIRQVWLGT